MTIQTKIEIKVIDDNNSEEINTTYPNTWIRMSVVDNKVVIRKVDLSEGTIEDPHEISGVKKEYFDFVDKNSIKKFIDDL